MPSSGVLGGQPPEHLDPGLVRGRPAAGGQGLAFESAKNASARLLSSLERTVPYRPANPATAHASANDLEVYCFTSRPTVGVTEDHRPVIGRRGRSLRASLATITNDCSQAAGVNRHAV